MKPRTVPWPFVLRTFPAKLNSVIASEALPVPPLFVSLASRVWLPLLKLGNNTLHAPDEFAVVVVRVVPFSLIVTKAFGAPVPLSTLPERVAVTLGGVTLGATGATGATGAAGAVGVAEVVTIWVLEIVGHVPVAVQSTTSAVVLFVEFATTCTVLEIGVDEFVVTTPPLTACWAWVAD